MPLITIEHAEILVERMSGVLPGKLQATAFGAPSKIPFKLASLQAILISRITDLSASAISLHKANHNVGAAIIARSIMETTSALFVLLEMAQGVVKTGEAGRFDEKITKMLLGSRNKSTPVQAPNVLDYMGRMDKLFAGFRSWYEELSEVAHPNFQGLMRIYSEFDRESFTLHLGGSPERRLLLGDKVGVSALCACLEISSYCYTQLAGVFESFSEVCHASEKACNTGVAPDG